MITPEIAGGGERGAPKLFATGGLDLRDLEMKITYRDFLFQARLHLCHPRTSLFCF